MAIVTRAGETIKQLIRLIRLIRLFGRAGKRLTPTPSPHAVPDQVSDQRSRVKGVPVPGYNKGSSVAGLL